MTPSKGRSRPRRTRCRFELTELEPRVLLARAESAFTEAAELGRFLAGSIETRSTSRRDSAGAEFATQPHGRATGELFRNLKFESRIGKTLRLDLYLPEGAAPKRGWPVVLAIHGGGWRQFSKDSYGPRAAALNSHGFAVVAPNYTLSAAGHPSWPANLSDLKGALHWVARHSHEYRLDSERIATMGESAGGHLALMLAMDRSNSTTTAALPRVRAVVDFYGPTELLRLTRESPAAGIAVGSMLGATAQGAPELYRDASPADRVTPKAPPVLILHGARDSLVPISQAELLQQSLAANGVPNRLIVLPGAKHGFGFRTAGNDLLATVASFLDQYLGV